MFPIRNEHELRIEKENYPVTAVKAHKCIPCKVRTSSTFKKCSNLRNRTWRHIGLSDIDDPTLPRQSAHRWRLGCQPYAPVVLYSP
jgi:hypothetical protein